MPAGTIWLPAQFLSVDEWLTSIADTDEELAELNIPRMRFLQNRWPVDKLVDLDGKHPADRISFFAMYVGQKAYIIMADSDYRLVAAIEPKDQPALYGVVLGTLLQRPVYRRGRRLIIKNRRPDLVPESAIAGDFVEESVPETADSNLRHSDLSEALVSWIAPWLSAPHLGYWLPDDESAEPSSKPKKRIA